MRILVPILLLLAGISLHAQPAEPVTPGRDLITLLPYIFFDSGSAMIPDRYVRFTSAVETELFSDTTIEGDALAHHRQMLNIIGYRLRRFPKTRVEIQGATSEQPYIGETEKIAEERGDAVRAYLTNVWGIDPSRLELRPRRGRPSFPSNMKDPRGLVENRRAEIISTDWEIVRPVWRSREASGGSASGSVDLYRLILLKFDSPGATPLIERALKEYLYPNITPGSRIVVTASTDFRYDYEHRDRLAANRSKVVADAIRGNVKPERYGSLQAMGLVSDAPDYPVELPEGRFYSRSVLVRVER